MSSSKHIQSSSDMRSSFKIHKKKKKNVLLNKKSDKLLAEITGIPKTKSHGIIINFRNKKNMCIIRK